MSERIQEVLDLFRKACVLSDEERESFLESACGEDEDLRTEVESMLAWDSTRGDVDAPHPVRAVLSNLAHEAGDEPVPETIGDYLVVRLIARGGMGVVYEAKQTKPARRVAIKVSRSASTTSEGSRRFELEAQLLARMTHPGIAHIIEAGTTSEEQGRLPYIVMELVEGQRLTDHASEHLGTVRSKLELVVRVCDAVAFAHGNGVIHRDLKPDNILIDDAGMPKVLDFGVAKVEDAGGFGAATLRTEAGRVIGTLGYMAPEQLGGKTGGLTPAADVYSLGVILYELLTGSLPHEFDAATLSRALAVVSSTEAPLLGVVRPEYRGDLEAVVAKALEKDPRHRYPDAAELKADIERHLRGETIHARSTGPLLRLTRWSQRNPALATAVVTLFALLVSGLAIVGYFLGETRGALGREQDAVAAYERVSDEFRLQQLVDEARDDLWPVLPEKAQSMESWLERAHRIAGLLPALQAELEGLRARALPWSPEAKAKDHSAERVELAALDNVVRSAREQIAALEGSGSSRVEAHREKLEEHVILTEEKREPLLEAMRQRKTYAFEDPADGWRHHRLAAFVNALEAFTVDDIHGETIASVKARLIFAQSVRRRSLEDHAEEWAEAIGAIAASPRYGGLRLRPQLGLVPLGPDSASGLWEFAHLETGTVPVRDPDTGKLTPTEESGLVFVLIPAGTVMVGAQAADPTGPNYDPGAMTTEWPPHEVTLDAYFLSKYEMTQGQWVRVAGGNPSFYPAGWEHAPVTLLHPVEQVSWVQCTEVLSRRGLLLPTEAQWENGCRAGTSSPWSTGKEKESLIGSVNLADRTAAAAPGSIWTRVWHELEDGFNFHAPIGTFAANPFGLHDMHGNVYEWVRDWYFGYSSPTRPGDGLRGEYRVPGRVYRGGGFSGPPSFARSAFRITNMFNFRNGHLGLRPARTVTR